MARTTRRIAKKWARQFSAAALSIPLTLEHAKPSLWTLSHGTQRHYVYRQSLELGIRPSYAKWATWRHFRRLAAGGR